MKLIAKFDMGDDGRPRAERSTSLRHYEITLQVSDIPADAYAVTYVLDSSYYDRVREVRSGAKNGFPEEITSYGDFTVEALVRTKSQGTVPVSSKLSEALLLGHRDALSDESIGKAIRNIRAH